MESRRPRFKRASDLPAIDITARDLEIIRLVHRHRFLRSSHITAMVGGQAKQIVRRLQLLYHHGYVERPRCQLDYYHKGGSRPMVYGIGNKGAAILSQKCGIPMHKIRWGEKNRSIGRVYLEHALLVSDIMVAIELACRKNGHVRLIWSDTLLAECGEKQFRWRVRIESGQRVGVIPDLGFALEQNGNRAFFFLEADRGTMPVVRNNPFQTSMNRKFVSYAATWSQSIHQTKFGFNRFRVLVVTKSEKRVHALIDACSDLERGQGLFLFAAPTIFEQPDILSAIWKTGRGDTSTLLA